MNIRYLVVFSLLVGSSLYGVNEYNHRNDLPLSTPEDTSMMTALAVVQCPTSEKIGCTLYGNPLREIFATFQQCADATHKFKVDDAPNDATNLYFTCYQVYGV